MTARHRILAAALFFCGAFPPAAVPAEAGRFLFSLGRVEVEHAGVRSVVQRGAAVEVGDTVHTGPNGRTQLRMKDGSLLALHPGSSMLIETHTVPAGAGPAAPAAPVAQPLPQPGRSVMRLLRGGFRTITGLIGRGTDDDYRVITPVATIGIRGTDYSAAYCSGDCAGTPDGLHVGVSNGGIVVFNDSGRLNLSDSQYGFVPGSDKPPEQQLEPPKVLEQAIEGGGDDSEEEGEAPPETPPPLSEDSVEDNAAEDIADSGTDTETGGGDTSTETKPPQDTEQPPPESFSTRGLAYANPVVATSRPNNNQIVFSADAALAGFRGADPAAPTTNGASYGRGSSSSVNSGFDPGTGLRWGRWSEGAAVILADGSTSAASLDLSNQSLHWIYGPASGAAPVMPMTGTATYALVGNTDPTDNLGNTGFLGSASLAANFTNQTVNSTVSLGMNNQVWTASSNITGPNLSAAGTFAGSYSTVSVTGVTGNGSGAFAGFFSGGSSTAPIPAGAGVSYSLVNGSTTVSGAAAFANASGN